MARFDAEGNILYYGESQKSDGEYVYHWLENGAEKSIYSMSLKELREKEKTENPALNIRTTPFDDISYECESIIYDVLRDYSKKATAIMNEEVQQYKEFLAFFEKELPDVYKLLMKNFRESKNEN